MQKIQFPRTKRVSGDEINRKNYKYPKKQFAALHTDVDILYYMNYVIIYKAFFRLLSSRVLFLRSTAIADFGMRRTLKNPNSMLWYDSVPLIVGKVSLSRRIEMSTNLPTAESNARTT